MASFANFKMMCVPAEQRSEGRAAGGEKKKGLGKTDPLSQTERHSVPSTAQGFSRVLFSEEDSKRPLRSPPKYICRLVRTPKFGTYASQNLISLSQPEALLSRKDHNEHHKVIIMRPNEFSVHYTRTRQI